MTNDGLTIEQDGEVVRVVIDAGAGNLFTPAMTTRLTELLLDPPDGAHVVRMTASGPEFCMGRAPFRSEPEALREDVGAIVDLVDAFKTTSLVTLAEVQGDAAGFGVGLVALSDVAVAGPRVHLSFPEVDAGFAPALVLTWLGDVVGRRQAFWLAATGVRVPAHEARDLGLLTGVVDSDGDLSPTVTSAVELLCSKPARVHVDVKELLRLYAAVPTGARGAVAVDRLAFGALRRTLAGAAR